MNVTARAVPVETKKRATMADLSLYLTNVNVSLGQSMDVVKVSEQLHFPLLSNQACCYLTAASCRANDREVFYLFYFFITYKPRNESLSLICECP